MSDLPAEPSDVLRRGLRLLARAVREQPRAFAVGVSGSATYAVMTVGSALVLGQVTNRLITPALQRGSTTAAALAAGAAAVFGVAVVKAVGIVFRWVGASAMQCNLQADYRRRVTRQYLRLPLAWHRAHPTGELLSNANSDVETAWWPISPFPFAVGVVVMLVVTAAALLLTDWVLALVGFTVFPAVAVLNTVYNRVMSPRARQVQELRGEVSGTAHESFDGALVVKTLGREADETSRFRRRAEALRDASVHVGRVKAGFDPVLQALPQLGTLVVLWVGTSRVAGGQLTTGGLVQVAYLFTLLAFPVQAIGWVLGELPRALVGYDRVSRVLAATGALPHGEHLLPGETGATRVELAEVGFSYGTAQVLHDIAFDVRPGRTVALVGPTGSGKSTLASLLVRLVDPSEGAVRLDGVDVRSLRPGVVSSVAALVPQHTFLFDDTVRGNVTLGVDVPDDDVWAALRLAQADGFVAALPHRLDTALGERGTRLSGGQRQRLALARALVRRPRLLVLDDATSSVDSRVEAAILAGLRDAEMPSTVVVVAYRRATIALADEVVFLDRGRIHDRGSHAELLARSPGYADLVTAYDTDEGEDDESAEPASARSSEPVR